MTTSLPANVTIVDLPAGTSLMAGTEPFESIQTTGGVGNSVYLTANQIASYVGSVIVPFIPSEPANTVLAGPTSGGSAVPTFRALVNGDLPQQTGLSVFGVTGSATAIGTAIPGTTDQVLRIAQNGTTLGFGAINLATAAAVTGLLGVVNGGTNTASLTAWGAIYANSTTNLQATAAATSGYALLSNGTTSAPSFQQINLTASITGVLGVPNGGTGTSSLTPRGVVLGGTNATAAVGLAPTVNTAGNILIDQGTTANPAFQTMTGDVSIAITGTATIGANKVTYSKFQQGTGLSVLGVAGTAVANYSAISGATDQVLIIAQNGTTLGFGAVNLATTAAVTGVLAVPTGGIGTGSITPRAVLLGGTNATAPIGLAPTVNTAGNLLIDQGTTANPAFKPATVDLSISTAGTATVTGLQSRALLSTAPTTSQVIAWNGVAWGPIFASGTLQKMTVYSTAGTTVWTAAAGTLSVVAICIGAGGAGGSASSTVATTIAAGAGGGGGAFALARITSSLTVTALVTIGTAGAPGAAGNVGGGQGGTSSFGSFVSAGGGIGGGGGPSGLVSNPAAGAGGTSTVGDWRMAGQGGVVGLAVNTAAGGLTFTGGGIGGAGAQGGGGANAPAGTAPGNAGGNYGGGGSGALSLNSGAAQTGGPGGGGVVVVWEYA